MSEMRVNASGRGRLMGLDFGSRTVGVAVSDGLGLTAQGLEIIRREKEDKLRRTLARIQELSEEYAVRKIIIGLPLHMNGDEGIRAEKSRAFAEQVARRTGAEVLLWDERLTTVEADEVMMEAGLDHRQRKEFVDMIAAQLILQGYMDMHPEDR